MNQFNTNLNAAQQLHSANLANNGGGTYHGFTLLQVLDPSSKQPITHYIPFSDQPIGSSAPFAPQVAGPGAPQNAGPGTPQGAAPGAPPSFENRPIPVAPQNSVNGPTAPIASSSQLTEEEQAINELIEIAEPKSGSGPQDLSFPVVGDVRVDLPAEKDNTPVEIIVLS